MNSVILLAVASVMLAIWLIILAVEWFARRNSMRIDQGPHKSTIRLAEQLDKAWRSNRRNERQS